MLLFLDIGFGTEDTFSIRTGYRDKNPETYTDTGMKSVFETMLNALKKDYADSLIDAKVLNCKIIYLQVNYQYLTLIL